MDSNIENMSAEELDKYIQQRREVLKEAEAILAEASRTPSLEKPSPLPSPPPLPTLAEIQRRRALLEATIVDAAIKKAQKEAQQLYQRIGERIERIQQGRPEPGDLPWEEPQTVTTLTQKRKMFPTDRTCASCGAQNIELPFPNPDPGRPVYCLKCNAERKSQRGKTTLSGASNQELQAKKEEELDRREDELRQAAAVLDKAKTGGKFSKKEQKLLRRLKRGESETSETDE